MFALRVVWGYVATWAEKHSGALLVVLFIIALMVVVSGGIRRDLERESEFIEWCKAEYAEEGHKDIERYCYYLHRGKVLR